MAVISAMVATTAYAELAPEVYIELQSKAPEVLKIRVDAVASSPEGLFKRSKWTENVTATVVDIVRTRSGLKKGDTIHLEYTRIIPEKGWVGPAPAPQLMKGREYMAFLSKTEAGSFSLAARGLSFVKVE